jgi:hypothetical protein
MSNCRGMWPDYRMKIKLNELKSKGYVATQLNVHYGLIILVVAIL